MAHLDREADQVCALARWPEDGISLWPPYQDLDRLCHADVLEVGVVNGALGQHLAPVNHISSERQEWF